MLVSFFFFNDTATTEIYTLSLHDALPIFTAWTTRVSNPVCYPCFRASASVTVQKVAFATGVLPNLYAFHRYTRNSTFLSCTLDRKSTRLNSSHANISYAVFCLKKKQQDMY